MASWIVHLRLAEMLLEEIDGLNSMTFAIGNIAPDSGIPDEEWKNFDPPTQVTHFKPEVKTKYGCEDLRFYRDCLAGETHREDPERYSFLLGYFFHLLTDNLWSEQVGIPTREKYAAEFEVDPDFIWEVKGDWYGLDFIYLRDHPDSLFQRVFLKADLQHIYLEFLPIEATRHQIDYIQQFYQRQDERIQAFYERPYEYLSQTGMDRFVDRTAKVLYKVYRYITGEKPDLDRYSSALELPALQAQTF